MPFWEQLVACLQRWKLPRRFPPPRGARVRAWPPPPRHAFLQEVRRCYAPRSDRQAPLQHDADDWGKGGGCAEIHRPDII